MRRGEILPTLAKVAEEDHTTKARFNYVAALALLAESPPRTHCHCLNHVLALRTPPSLMDILHDAGVLIQLHRKGADILLTC